jgi:hypothetical protein
MNRNIQFHIVHPQDSIITFYVRKLYDYVNDGENGHIEFNGYIYYDVGNETKYNRSLTKSILCMTEYSAEGIVNSDKPEVTTYSFIQHHIYEVEFYRREIIKNTNAYSTIEEDDGTEMNVCFFPTDRQRVYFKVLREILEGDPVPDEYKPKPSVVS